MSATLWSEYFSFSTQPSCVGMVFTPSRMHGSRIFASGYLHEDRAIGYFSFRFCCWLEVTTSICLLSVSGSSWTVISSTRPSCCCVVSALVVSNTIDFIYAVAWPFSCWAPLTIAVSGGFLVLCAGFPCVLLVGLTSMADMVGPYRSSTTGIGSMGSTKGEGIASMSGNSSSCLVSSRLLLPPVVLDYFGFSFLLGSTHPYLVVPSWVLVIFYRLSLHWFTLDCSPTSFHSVCSISLQLHDFTMSLMLLMFPLYIGKS
jgi:hypothetical protein